jgi:membrane protease YdiL (CAAX protease family)
MSAPAFAKAAGFWSVVRLLLAASYRRAVGRRRRQRELLSQRVGGKATNWPGLIFVVLVIVMGVLHLMAGAMVYQAVANGERYEAERQGWVLVDADFISAVNRADRSSANISQPALDRAFHAEASTIASRRGGIADAIEARLRQTVRTSGSAHLLDNDDAAPGLAALPSSAGVPGLLGSLVLLAWGLMLVCQGEGLELDLQRRRHPMWEWLFSHPVQPPAVFLAELLSPIAANPIYLSAPLFVGLVYGLVYGAALGWLAGLLIGIPLTVAAACLGKALEIAITLRFPPRSRGAMIGLMSWLGYATLMGFVAIAVTAGKIFGVLAPVLAPLAGARWVLLGLFLGARGNGGFSFPRGLITDWVAAAMVIAGSVAFSVWGARKGLGGNQGHAVAAPRARRHGGGGFGRNAIYRKELLWFARDRSALVQAVLIPLTLAGYQLFNMRGLMFRAEAAWYTLCGAAILFGTYFLLVLGPKSLASEGTALWIALTWPQGLEKLLKAKAWLWTMISCAIVAPVLIYAAVLFPASTWKVALVAIAWVLFARSMAAKTVTLATITAESGEIRKVARGRQWATQLGMATFAIGVLTQQWNVAAAGVFYSIMTAAAMWQNFRARLPYLYDPWSETLPRPPTLMHAMIAISILVESGAVITGGMRLFLRRDQIAMAQAAVYGLCAIVVSVCLGVFLYKRGVKPAALWRWQSEHVDSAPSASRWRLAGPGYRKLLVSLALGAALGVALAAVALLYLRVLRHFPALAAMMDRSDAEMAAIPHLRMAMLIMGVLFAPFAEEFLFRGLLFRALDREWGGWRAVGGSAAFFAIYHPTLSWLPVGLLGATNALLFKQTGRLAPCVIVHMVYNAIILT